jgi:hypothetical protein
MKSHALTTTQSRLAGKIVNLFEAEHCSITLLEREGKEYGCPFRPRTGNRVD